MPRADRASCRNCGRHRNEVGPISHGGNCGDCGRALLLANIDGMRYKRGPSWARQQIGTVLAAVGDPRIVNALIDGGVFAYEALDAALPDAHTSAHA